ncbi:sulfatase-like hydrolase/transferase [Paenibacillus sp. IB182496]|uniref:Sulfatase-like hydrolase/transferase n=1 Tax=Paenibacillus sabuli TaxID=2772509 RepID=A0A927GUX0_9BACL|nr:sulfatase-like hydrolase/transferase [Paenibacillus sabuli]MBD2848147.1 sulfatase-like hydrolase/transferase [Paenibacillus sabuli]
MVKQPHIVIFNPDQWRSDVMGHLGNPAAITPNLDRMAATDGVSFRNAFCQNTVCTPSRCSFMSGWYPHVRGHRTMYHMMQPDEPVLLKTLKARGYFVWWGGKNDLVPAENGYSAYCDVKYEPERTPRPETNLHARDAWRGDPEGDNYYSFYAGQLEKAETEDAYYDGDWANVLGAIEQIRNAPADQPLCIYLPLLYPHPPYGVEEPYFSMIDRAKLPPRIPAPTDWSGKPSLLKGIHDKQRLQGWDQTRWNELRATYYGMCARVDQQFGMVMDALREVGMYDETAVFFFSDHGDFTGDYGLVEKTQNTFEDCLSRVPFVVKPPKAEPVQPRVSDALVELIDFSATVEALLGIEPAHSHYGRSLLPLIAGETDSHRDAVFCEGGRRHGEQQCMERESASAGNSGLYSPRIQWQLQEGPEHTKAVMCRTHTHKYVRRLYEQDELYELGSDPGETVNRIQDPALSTVLAELKERMLTFYQETCDAVPHRANRRM